MVENKKSDHEFDHEVIDIDGVPHLKITYIKEQSKDGQVTRHTEGWEIHSAGEAADILEAENQRVKQLEEAKTKKIVLTSGDHIWLKTQERVKKYQDFKNKQKQAGPMFEEVLKQEEQNIVNEKEVRDVWSAAVASLTKEIKARGLVDKVPEVPEAKDTAPDPATPAEKVPETVPDTAPKEAEGSTTPPEKVKSND